MKSSQYAKKSSNLDKKFPRMKTLVMVLKTASREVSDLVSDLKMPGKGLEMVTSVLLSL